MDKKINFTKLSAWFLVLPLIIGASAVVILFLFGFERQQNDFENFALGESTFPAYAMYDGNPIHCTDVEDADFCLEGSRQRGGLPTALWLGNSQVHAINQFQPGQENGSPVLFRLLRQRNIDLITFSQPNASLQEHYVLFEYLRQRLPLSILILPVVFDDLRETGIRDGIAPALQDDATVVSLQRTPIGESILAQFNNKAQLAAGDKGKAQTLQDRSEAEISGWLNKTSELWALRPQIRGKALISLYQLRNTVFGIKPTSKRRIIRGRYQANMAALAATIVSANSADIKVLLYIVPLRDDVEIPYDRKEYEGFKTDVISLARRKNVSLVNLEHLVPSKYWGAKASTSLKGETELDFMHFQAAGHKLLARELYNVICRQVLGSVP